MQKRTIAMLAVIAAVCAGVVALFATGNVPSSCSSALPASLAPSAANAPVAAAFDAITDASEENVRARMGDAAYDALVEAGADPLAIYKALFAKLSYEVEDRDLPEDASTATCGVNVTNADIMAAVNAYQNGVAEWAMTEEALATLSASGTEGMTAKTAEILLEALTSDDVEERTRLVVVNLERGADGSWQVADPEALGNAALGGVDLANLF